MMAFPTYSSKSTSRQQLAEQHALQRAKIDALDEDRKAKLLKIKHKQRRRYRTHSLAQFANVQNRMAVITYPKRMAVTTRRHSYPKRMAVTTRRHSLVQNQSDKARESVAAKRWITGREMLIAEMLIEKCEPDSDYPTNQEGFGKVEPWMLYRRDEFWVAHDKAGRRR